ncbi:MAG TPA: zf-HC2 domain-containing protein [Ktedonobacterales bacterium]|nr:zf-HC2 domain-containing protein [Ktedonobacterales bacterium]
MSEGIVMGCPLNVPVATLSAWRDSALPATEMTRIREHLPECPACEQRLAEYDAIASALRHLRVPLPVGGYGHNPRLSGRVAPGQPRARPAFHIPTMLETLAAALVITLLASAFISLRMTGTVMPRAFTAFALPNAASHPTTIIAGPDGALWFTESGRGAIGRITPQGQLAEFALAGAGVYPTSLIVGPDGKLWFAEEGANAIGSITLGGAITEYPFVESLHPNSIAAGADGNLWFTTAVPRHVMRMSPSGRLLGDYAIPAAGGGLPVLTRGPDGNLWFAVPGTNTIGRISLSGAVTAFHSTATVDGPIVSGPDGNLWFSGDLGTRLGRVTPQGHFTIFPAGGPLLGAVALPGTIASLTAGPDGAVWLALNAPAHSSAAPQVGRITPGGTLTLTPIPLHGIINDLTFGPGGQLWLTFNDIARIGRLTLST